MPSPFPGMDPYLEAPDIWPDLHHALAREVTGALNASLPLPYYARLNGRPEVQLDPQSEPLRHLFGEVRDPTCGHRLITLIEIASPSSKHPGPDREAYLHKRREILESDASLIELDLLRKGGRLVPAPAGLEPRTDYVVLVNRAWRRTGPAASCELFPVSLAGALPVIPVPLREGQAEVPLDLQYAFNRAYD